MAKKTKPGDSVQRGTNLSETKEIIRYNVDKILALKGERKEINAAMAEARARVKNAGVPVAALDLAIKMKEIDLADREALDEGYAIARDALGIPMQTSLFDMINTQDDQPPAKAKSSKAKEQPGPAAPPSPADNSDLAGEDGDDKPHGQGYDPDFDDAPTVQ